MTRAKVTFAKSLSERHREGTREREHFYQLLKRLTSVPPLLLLLQLLGWNCFIEVSATQVSTKSFPRWEGWKMVPAPVLWSY